MIVAGVALVMDCAAAAANDVRTSDVLPGLRNRSWMLSANVGAISAPLVIITRTLPGDERLTLAQEHTSTATWH